MPSRKLEAWALALVLCAHVALGVYYSVVIPIWEAHDEIGHYYFVRYIASEHRLPTPGQRLVKQNDEAHQPPLYYLLAAIPVSLVNVNDGVEPHLNPYMWWGAAQGGFNRVVHDPLVERWPYHGTVLAVHLARWVSVLLGAAGIVFTYLAARVLFPGQPSVRWGAVLVTMLWPHYRFSSAVVNNDVMVTACAAAVVWLLARVVVADVARARDVLALGIALGLALLSKNNSLGLVPAVLLGLVIWARRRSWRVRGRLLMGMGGGLLLSLVLGGLWYARNASSGVGIFGARRGLDWLLQRIATWSTANGGMPIGLVLLALLKGTGSAWASYGWGNIGLSDSLYAAAASWVGLGLGGVLVWLWRRPPRKELAGLGVCALVVLGVCGEAVVYSLGSRAPEVVGRYLLPAVPALSILLGAGWAAILGQRLRAAGLAVMGVALALQAVLVPVLLIRSAYAAPVQISEAQAGEYVPVHAVFGQFVELVGYRLSGRFVERGGKLPVALVWRVLSRTDVDYSLALQVLEGEDRLVGRVARFPGRGAYATSTWQPGSIFVEEAAVPIDEGEAAAGPGWLEVSFFRKDKNVLLPVAVSDANGMNLGNGLRLQRIKLRGVGGSPNALPAQSLGFGPAIRLAGGEAVAEAVGEASRLHIRLTWGAEGVPDADYTISLQLRDANNAVVAQDDSPPWDGAYPTSLWEAGDTIADEYTLPLPAGLARGTYTLSGCVYNPIGYARLPVSGAGGLSVENAEAPLLTVYVQADGAIELTPAWTPLVIGGTSGPGT